MLNLLYHMLNFPCKKILESGRGQSQPPQNFLLIIMNLYTKYNTREKCLKPPGSILQADQNKG